MCKVNFVQLAKDQWEYCRLVYYALNVTSEPHRGRVDTESADSMLHWA